MADGEHSGPLSTKLCPGCGVAVPPGYIKCPRCHTELPQTQPGAGRRRAATDGGGTSVSPGPERTLIYIGVAAIALIGVVTWVLVRGGSSPAAAAAGEDAAVDDTTDTGDTGGDTGTGDQAPPDRLPAPVAQGSDQAPPPPSPAAAIGELGRELREERLWASVTADGSTVVIDSSFCDDAGLSAIVSSSAGALRDARFTDVRCRAPHGAVVFEHAL